MKIRRKYVKLFTNDYAAKQITKDLHDKFLCKTPTKSLMEKLEIRNAALLECGGFRFGILPVSSITSVVLLCMMTLSSLAQNTWYVKVGGAGVANGTSWTNATGNLQAAIDSASVGDSIWVAEGVYRPIQAFGGMTIQHRTFFIDQAIKIFGGFSGSESAISERDWRKHQTVLDGALNSTDSVYHVLYLDGTTNNISGLLLDGLAILHGRANGFNSGDKEGGGVYLDCSANNCSPAFRNCYFSENAATKRGGALYLAGAGAGSNCSPSIIYCTFDKNAAENGAAIFSNGQSDGKSTPIIFNSEFYDNEGPNAAVEYHANNGIASRPIIFATTFANNQLSAIGVVANNNLNFILDLQSSILWNNGIEIFSTNDNVLMAYCLIDDGIPNGMINQSGIVDFGGNLDSNPLFVDQTNGNLRLHPGSPAIDVGWTVMLPPILTEDLVGKPRVNNGEVDMGAYENYCPYSNNPILVDINATGENTGLTWTDAITNLQEGIEQACSCDTGQTRSVWVADGTYKPNMEVVEGNSQSARFSISKDVQLFGGFSGNEISLNQRQLSQHPTILSGDIGIENNSSDNVTMIMEIFASNGVDITRDCIIDGFIFRDAGYDLDQSKGAIHLLKNGALNTPIIANCQFQNNQSVTGGGINNLSGSPIIYNCAFQNNKGYDGGAIMTGSFDSTTLIVNCTFFGNEATQSAGAIFHTINDLDISNCIFWDNGDEIVNNGSTVTIDHSTFDDGNQDGNLILPPGLVDGGGNLDSDPLFVDSALENLRLIHSSPSIGKGSNAAAAMLVLDLDGLPRFTGIIDMGPYENPYGPCDLPPVIDNTYGPIDGLYQAETPVILGNNAAIKSGADVVISSPVQVLIENNVHIEPGASFEIIIRNCTL